MLSPRALPFALLAIALAGCSDAPDIVDPTVLLEHRAEQVRELSFEHDVPIVRVSRDEFEAQQKADADATDQADLDELAATYGRLGFFDPTLDLRTAVATSHDWVGGTYSSKTGQITLVGDVSDDLIVHELVHGLQDQHFDLAKYEHQPTTDAYMARAGVVEGDAELAQWRYITEEKYGRDLDDLLWGKAFSLLQSDSNQMLVEAKSPAYFSAYPAYAYSYGLAYCAHTLMGITWDHTTPTARYPYAWTQEDLRFDTLIPSSTAQVVSLDDGLPGPATVGLDDVPHAVADQLVAVDWDVIGAWYGYILFHPVLAEAGLSGPVEIASSWSGDRVLFVRDASGEHVGLAWTSLWRDDAAAAKIEHALRALHGIGSSDGPLTTAKDGETVWLERQGSSVVFVKNVDPSVAPKLAAAAFDPPDPNEAHPRIYPPLGARVRFIDRPPPRRP